jgi:ATP-dependent exoDNAse (exonuclease V) beta subunit
MTPDRVCAPPRPVSQLMSAFGHERARPFSRRTARRAWRFLAVTFTRTNSARRSRVFFAPSLQLQAVDEGYHPLPSLGSAIPHWKEPLRELELARINTIHSFCGDRVVDLAFREEAADFEWTVVDFKTDREFELHHTDYTAQVALYAQAIEKATNSSVSGILLVI